MTYGATVAYISPLAAIGNPPEHRDHRAPFLAVDQAYGPFYPLLHQDVIVEAFVTIDSGTYRPTEVGPRTWLMKRVHLGHDVVVGADCEFSPGATIGGSVTIGNRVRIGMNATVRPFITVGDGARIGLGAAVVKNIPANECWAGNPARFLHHLCPDCGGKLPHEACDA